MPRFYFNLFNDLVTKDEEGLDLPGLLAAQQEARKGAAGVIGEQLEAGNQVDPNHRIEVEDDQRRLVYTLRFSELIKGDC
jgi:hypothetical protein